MEQTKTAIEASKMLNKAGRELFLLVANKLKIPQIANWLSKLLSKI